MGDKCNCYRFSPRDSLSGAVAQIADYLSKHPGWNETELRAFVDGLISSVGVETFNGRSGNVTLNKDDVNNLLIANCYFAEADETIESIDVLALYKLGIRIIFTQYSSEVDGYTLAYGIEYYPTTDAAKAYLFSSGSGGAGAVVSVNGKTGTVVLKASDILMNNGDSVENAVSNTKAIANAAYSPDNPPPYPVNSVNSKTGSVMLKVVDVSNGDSVDDNAYIFIDETENYPDIIAPDSNKLGGKIPSYYATAESVNSLKNDLNAEKTARKNADDVLSARMDAFTALPNGATTGDAELMDIRVGADGKTYTSAGEAVRGQIGAIKDDLDLQTKNIIAENDTFEPSSASDVKSYPIDFAYKHYVTIKNNRNSSAYIFLNLCKNGMAVQGFSPEVQFEANEEKTFEIFNVNANGVLDGWIENDKYFTDYTWTLAFQSPNIAPITISIFNYKKDNPLKSDGVMKNIIIVDKNDTDEYGIDGAFNDINSAIAYAKSKVDVVNIPVTIFIKNGEYNLKSVASRNTVIEKGGNKISLIGESRDGVVITLNSTPAKNNKVIEHGGDSIIANLTIKNLWTEDGSAIDYSHNSYCIHNDIGFNTSGRYRTVVKNCYVYSEAFAPIGAGLQGGQTQVYEDCIFEFNSLDERENGYNQWAPLYVHGPASPTANNCALIVDNCTCIARKGTKAITLPNVAGSLQYIDIPVTIRRTIGVTNGSVITDVSKLTHNITIDSALNNVDSWNY